jgi:hypothetical protein
MKPKSRPGAARQQTKNKIKNRSDQANTQRENTQYQQNAKNHFSIKSRTYYSMNHGGHRSPSLPYLIIGMKMSSCHTSTLENIKMKLRSDNELYSP